MRDVSEPDQGRWLVDGGEAPASGLNDLPLGLCGCQVTLICLLARPGATGAAEVYSAFRASGPVAGKTLGSSH
jgi:hypothetical protein